jgi:hypothetical protein
MRIAIGLLSAALVLAGCAHHQAAPKPAPPVTSQKPAPVIKPVIKPDLQISGQVAMVNAAARFVVITFPPGPMPQPGRRLSVYHNGLKVGEISVTGPQQENDTVADIVTGNIQVHDEARAD